ncbi:NUDIX domain-containing protein [Kribbella sp. VKM Ac-2568]|uniref:NUDIX domain-containing protein n=1 Tax=Kribbella sp. VKM Ac-2568 TaxID=2512219 RepID=UPI0010431842|nr:NUDIX domain-containing protein [Kribbella sp. VKM Ac-2568]TCM50220.1 8-oxo-dGTP pyrophosphatase MutT (NUDIX family) [Kribbella sp. VKM Ac-2568]
MLLGSFVHDPDLDLTAPTLQRTSVRGVLFRDDRLLLLASRHGDYKFPGGGVEGRESIAAALQREFLEECGLPGVEIGLAIGITTEYLRAIEPEYEVFKQTSHYFYCTSDSEPSEPELEGYEAELELEPRWVTVSEALEANRAVRAGGIGVMRWLDREIQVLSHLADL